MLTLVKIDGKVYDALITAIEENYNVVEGENSGISLYRSREIRDLQGIKIGHNITFSPDNDPDAFDELCEYLFGSLRESVVLEVIHGQKVISYEAAYNTGSRRVAYINDREDFVGWSELTVSFRPMECQVVEKAVLNLAVLGDMVLGRGV